MQTLEDLIAVEEIKKLKATYLYTLDTKDWAGYAATFTEDADIDFSSHADLVTQNASASGELAEGTGLYTGGAELVATLEVALADVVSAHHCHDPQITLTGPDSATGIWAMVDRLQTAEELFVGYGHYHEEYVRTADGWRISKLLLTRLLGTFEWPSVVRYPRGG